ncbi:MAG: RNA polymerase sigma-70 factor [Bacteroidales bacterium]|nr:RNA polymerase sigma-70 factor [Bacteroidales bacterium]
MDNPGSYKTAGYDFVVALSRGSHRAFEAFYRMEYNNLVHFAQSYLGNRQEAEDIAQESLLKIWERRQTLNPLGNLRALTFTIARNAALDILRKRSDNASLEACRHLEDNSLTECIDALDLGRLISETFDQLPPKLQKTFRLNRSEGLSYKEIARMESVSVKTVEYRISTVLKNFKRVLG